GFLQARRLVLLQYLLKLFHILHDLPTHLCPANFLWFVSSLSADVDNVVFHFLGTKCTRGTAFSLGFIGADRKGRLQEKARIEKTLKHRNPRPVLVMVKGKGQ